MQTCIYGPAVATATHCILLQQNPDWFLHFWYRLTQVVLEKRPLNGCSGSNFVRTQQKRSVYTGESHGHAYGGAHGQVGAGARRAVLGAHAAEVGDDDAQLTTALLLQLTTHPHHHLSPHHHSQHHQLFSLFFPTVC